MTVHHRFRMAFGLFAFIASLGGAIGFVCAADEKAITFIVTSDSHYKSHKDIEMNDRNKLTIERMNVIQTQTWPAKLGGGAIGKPLGVLALGDLVDDGDKANATEFQWKQFASQFGLDGTDGLLKYPVFEGWGNHDGPPMGKERFGFSVQAQLKARNAERKKAGRISHVSDNGLHYSWDWGGIHFVQTNIYPADKQHVKIRYSPTWHDPQGALTFLKEDLKANVGDTGRPVIIMSHCGVDTDWWHPEDWAAMYAAIKPYNVITYFYGHSGTGVRKWAPQGEQPTIDVVNTGQTAKGFFVVEIAQTRMRLAYQIKKPPAPAPADAGKAPAPAEPKTPDKANAPLEWEWKYPLEKTFTRGQPETNAK